MPYNGEYWLTVLRYTFNLFFYMVLQNSKKGYHLLTAMASTQGVASAHRGDRTRGPLQLGRCGPRRRVGAGLFYSAFRAEIGFTPLARRAGMYAATAATPPRTMGTAMNVTASNESIPISKL